MNTLKSKGFTLIELLVVILIIGILAAIALPQYQLVVDKSNFAKYQAMVTTLRNAYDEYVLVNGQSSKAFDDLILILPSNFTKSYSDTRATCKSNADMYCCIVNSGSSHTGNLNCGSNDLSVTYFETLLGHNNTSITRNKLCLALPESKRGNKLCASLGSAVGTPRPWTPQGRIYLNAYLI